MIEQDHHVQAVDLRYSVLEFIDILRSHTGTGIFATTNHDWHVEVAQLKSA
ncbi:MAG: hypothetical protein OXN16_17715 [Gammaproteobacteria bacterium]|nr:hypothetical protein [Gammaproteobacteria bacterium]